MASRPAPAILEACADAALLGVDLYPAQAEFLEVCERDAHVELVACWGRRSGKSLVAAIWATYDAIFRDLTEYLRWRERRSVVIVAASREQAGVTLGYVRELLENSPTLASAIAGQTDESVTISQPLTGARVTIRTAPCSARSIRGQASSSIVFDEVGHWLTDSEGPAVATRVYRSLRPSVVQFHEHGRALLISSPWGRQGLFYERYEQAASGRHPEMYASRLATWEVNPTLTRRDLEAEQRRDPIGFASEYQAVFEAGGDGLFDAGQLDAAVRRRRELRPGDRRLGACWVGLDAAFTRDAFAAVVVGRDAGDRSRLRLAAARVWRPVSGQPLDFDEVMDEVAALAKRYGARRAVADQHAGEPITQRLRKSGVHAAIVPLTAQSTPVRWQALRSAVADGDLELYQHDDLLAELRGITVFHGSGGRIDVRQPRTAQGHADLASALMLVVSEAPRAAGDPRVVSAARVRLDAAVVDQQQRKRLEAARAVVEGADHPGWGETPVQAVTEPVRVRRMRGMTWPEFEADVQP